MRGIISSKTQSGFFRVALASAEDAERLPHRKLVGKECAALNPSMKPGDLVEVFLENTSPESTETVTVNGKTEDRTSPATHWCFVVPVTAASK